jgi:hypothetical protein
MISDNLASAITYAVLVEIADSVGPSADYGAAA